MNGVMLFGKGSEFGIWELDVPGIWDGLELKLSHIPFEESRGSMGSIFNRLLLIWLQALARHGVHHLSQAYRAAYMHHRH